MGKGKDIPFVYFPKSRGELGVLVHVCLPQAESERSGVQKLLSYLVSSKNRGGAGISLGNYSSGKLAVLENLINNMINNNLPKRLVSGSWSLTLQSSVPPCSVPNPFGHLLLSPFRVFHRLCGISTACFTTLGSVCHI